jgi:hypothetical protein
MSARKSAVWRAFDKVERAVGKPLEDAVASPTYVDVMLAGLKVQRAIGGAVVGVAGGLVGRVLRVANVPTRGDVLNLSRQMAVLTREVRDIAAEQQRQAAKPKPAAKRRR